MKYRHLENHRVDDLNGDGLADMLHGENDPSITVCTYPINFIDEKTFGENRK
jgi:hypothetical protein